MHIELSIDALHLGTHGMDRDNKFLSNGGIGVASGQEMQDLKLSRSERLTGQPMHLHVRRHRLLSGRVQQRLLGLAGETRNVTRWMAMDPKNRVWGQSGDSLGP